jgi:CBS-domain-containing membrane protein
MDTFIKLLQTQPLAFKNDPIPHVRNLMRKFYIEELPVIDENNLLGTIFSKKLVSLLNKTKIENLLAYHAMDENFISLQIDAQLKSLVEEFIKRNRCIACIFASKEFRGYVHRRKLLKLLINSKEKIAKFVSKNYISLDYEDSMNKLVKILKKNLPVLVLKDNAPLAAFSPEELYHIFFTSDYITKKFKKDFETLRGEKRKFLKLRINRQLLRQIKESIAPRRVSPIKVNDIIRERLVISKEKTVGSAAKTMLTHKRSAIATANGPVTDLNLLKVLL